MQLTFQNVLGQKGLVTYYEKTTKHEYAKQQKDCKKHHLSKSLFKTAKLGDPAQLQLTPMHFPIFSTFAC